MFSSRMPGDQAVAASSGGDGAAPRRPPETSRNALGVVIEHRFNDANAPCRSYSELERRSGVSREALSRYITARPDRRRSPTVDTLTAIAAALDMNIETLCRAASMRGPGRADMEQVGTNRSEQAAPLLAQLGDQQFHALMAFLRQMVLNPQG